MLGANETDIPVRHPDIPPERLANVVPRETVRVQDIYVNPTAPAYASVTTFDYHNVPHAHEFIEILVVVGGRGTHTSARGTIVMETGSVFVVRPGAWHVLAKFEELVLAIIGISLNTLRADLSFLRARAATRDLLYVGPIGAAERGVWMTEVPIETAREIADRVRRLEALLLANPDATLVVLGELIAVLGTISQATPASDTREHVHRAVADVLDLLDASPQRAWRAADLGAAVNLDVAYLTRIFREDMGVPPIAYLARVRAEKAAHLLAATDLPISQIGIRVGWPIPTYFARRFQALIGLKPSDYRRHIQAGGVDVLPHPAGPH